MQTDVGPEIVTFEMTKRKETKGTVVFENDDAPVPSMYVRKGNPFAKAQVINVTLATAVPRKEA